MEDKENVVPVFIFSLPRSGSTLLQRLISSHPQVGTTGEPWIQLLLLGGLRQGEVYADYDHSIAVEAIRKFFESLPNGRKTYLDAVNTISKKMYKEASGKPFFVDKTPRYSLICDEIINTFPDAKYIFLWRHPLSVVASISNTWGQGNWNPNRHKSDLYIGLRNLIKSYSEYKDKSFCLKYEDLTRQPEKEIDNMLGYIGIKSKGKKVVERYKDGRGWRMSKKDLGDPTLRRKELNKILIKGEYEWVKDIKNILRKRWSKKYIEWIGKKRMNTMGYSFEKTVTKIIKCEAGMENLISDLYANYVKDWASFFVEPRIVLGKFDKLSKGGVLNNYG
jgi:hypothetical protein